MKWVNKYYSYIALCIFLGLPAQAFAALTLQVQVNPDPVIQGESMLVKYTVTNTGTLPLFGVVLEADVPAGLNTIFSANISDSGTCPGGNCQAGESVTWNLSAIGPGANIERTIRTVLATTAIDGTNLAFSAQVADTGVENDLASKTVVVNSQRAFDLAIDVDFNPSSAGDVLTYTLTYGNRTAATASSVQLSLPLPANVTLLSATGGGNQISNTVQWTLGTLTAGAIGHQQVLVQLAAGVSNGDTLQIDAAQISGTVNFLSTNTKAMRTSRVNNSLPLKLALAVNPDPVLPSQLINVVLTVTNPTASPLFNTVLELIVPAGLNTIFTSSTSDAGICPGGNCQAGETLTWSLGVIAPFGSAVVHVSPTISNTLVSGQVMGFEARVTDANSDNVSTSQSVVVDSLRALELGLDTDFNPVGAGDTLTYNLTYSNSSAASANNVQMSLPLPTNTTLISATGGGILIGNTVQWSLGSLTAGIVDRHQVTVQVDGALPDAELLHVNAAQIEGTVNFLPTHTRAARHTRVDSSVPITLALAIKSDPVFPNEVLHAVLTVTNPTASPLLDLEVQIRVPAGLNTIFTSNISDGGICPGGNCQGGEMLTWNIGNLGPSASIEINVTPTVLAALNSGNIIPFEAKVQDGNADSTATSQSIPVDSFRVLDLSLDTNTNPVAAGNLLTYELTYGNRSASLATNVLLSLLLPPEVTLMSATGGGTLVNGAVEWPLPDLQAGQGGRKNVTVQVNATLADADLLTVDSAEISATSNFLLTSTRAKRITRVDDIEPLALTMSANPNPVLPNQAFDVLLTVENTSAGLLLGAELQLRIPDGLNTIFSTTIVGGGVCPGGNCQKGELLTWPLGNLSPGAVVQVSVTPTTLSTLPHGQVLFFDAEVVDNNGDSASASESMLIGNFIDDDFDGISNLFDNCSNTTNADQLDTDNDGIGDACQCGDVNGDGFITNTDAVLIQRHLLSLPPGIDQAFCDVNGDGQCTNTDAVIIKRKLLSLPPGLSQTCTAASSV